MAKHSYHMVKGAALAVAPYSHYVDGGDGYVFITGQIGMTPGKDNAPIPKDMAAETRRTMDNLIIILKDAGLTLADVVTSRVFLTDFERDYEKMNATYRSYFKPGHLPARTCIGVTALARGGKLEIDFICKRPATAKRKAAKRATRRR
ncbi:MAG: RidA family protein [Alphaproteobacteria bacterium]|nr:RidA family protein [Alphaproteobacteria bacterium]